VEQFSLSLYEINNALTKEDDEKPDIHTIVMPKYHDYLEIFKKANADKLCHTLKCVRIEWVTCIT
jgi:hypothetical protein